MFCCLPLLLGLKWTGTRAVAQTLSSYVIFELFDVGNSGHPMYIGTCYGYPGGRPSNFLIPGSPCIEGSLLGCVYSIVSQCWLCVVPPWPWGNSHILVIWNRDFPAVLLLDGFSVQPSSKSALPAQVGSASRSSSQLPEQTDHQENRMPVYPLRRTPVFFTAFSWALSHLASFFPSYTASYYNYVCYSSFLSC